MLKPIKKIGAKLSNVKTTFFIAKYMSLLTQEFELVGESISCMSKFTLFRLIIERVVRKFNLFNCLFIRSIL